MLYTDASDYAISRILTQEHQTISCFSKKLSGPQLNYMVTDKELLAVYKSLKFNHNVIYGCYVTVMTNHKNLTHMELPQNTNQQVLCQRLATNQEYHMKLFYYDGKSNTSADGLLLLPFDIAETNKTCEAVFATETSHWKANPLFPLNFHKIAETQKTNKQLVRVKEKTYQIDKFSEI